MDNMLILHSRCDQIVLSKNSLSTVNQSSQCSQDVITGFQVPLPPVTITSPPCIYTTRCTLMWIDSNYCESPWIDFLSTGPSKSNRSGSSTIAPGLKVDHNRLHRRLNSYSLGARGHLPSGYIVSLLWVLKQFTQSLPSRYVVSSYQKYPPKYPLGTFWTKPLSSFQKNPPNYPVGTFWTNAQSSFKKYPSIWSKCT